MKKYLEERYTSLSSQNLCFSFTKTLGLLSRSQINGLVGGQTSFGAGIVSLELELRIMEIFEHSNQ